MLLVGILVCVYVYRWCTWSDCDETWATFNFVGEAEDRAERLISISQLS